MPDRPTGRGVVLAPELACFQQRGHAVLVGAERVAGRGDSPACCASEQLFPIGNGGTVVSNASRVLEPASLPTVSPMSEPLTVAAAIRYCREKRALSAAALSRQAGLGAAYVSRVEAGAIQPSLRAFASMATALSMSDKEIGIVIAVEAAAASTRAAE